MTYNVKKNAGNICILVILLDELANQDAVQDKKQLLLEMWKEQATLYGIDPLKIKIEKQRNDGPVPVENKIEAIKTAIQESMKEKEGERYDSRLVDENNLVLYVKKG